MGSENKNKYDLLIHLLGEGDAMVCLDARVPEVDVPTMHKDNSALSLIFNLNFKRPMDVQEDGIYATLGFGGRSHECIIPFNAVWAIYEPESNKGQVWEESFPKDLRLKAETEVEVGAGAQAEVPVGVRSVSTESSAANKANSETIQTKTKSAKPKKSDRSPKDRSHLRVIK